MQNVWREVEDRRQGDSLGATASVQGKDVIMTMVVEEEMQRGQMGRTKPTRKGRDLGIRERWESKMAPGEVRGNIQNHNSQRAEQSLKERG